MKEIRKHCKFIIKCQTIKLILLLYFINYNFSKYNINFIIKFNSSNYFLKINYTL